MRLLPHCFSAISLLRRPIVLLSFSFQLRFLIFWFCNILQPMPVTRSEESFKNMSFGIVEYLVLLQMGRHIFHTTRKVLSEQILHFKTWHWLDEKRWDFSDGVKTLWGYWHQWCCANRPLHILNCLFKVLERVLSRCYEQIDAWTLGTCQKKHRHRRNVTNFVKTKNAS